jgi:hypothetical protein
MCPEPQVGHIDKHKVTCGNKIFYLHLGKKTYQKKKNNNKEKKSRKEHNSKKYSRKSIISVI